MFIARKDEHTSFVDAFGYERLTGSLCQEFAKTLTLKFGMDNGMVDIAASAIMPGEDATDQPPVPFEDKAGVGVAREKSGDAFHAVIQAAQTAVEARAAAPEFIEPRIIFE